MVFGHATERLKYPIIAGLKQTQRSVIRTAYADDVTLFPPLTFGPLAVSFRGKPDMIKTGARSYVFRRREVNNGEA
jgi:hypothetical protein